MTTLGWLKFMEDPAYLYFEWQYRQQIHMFLTEKWWILQSGWGEDALKLWLLVMKVLEFDLKSMRDMFLLLQTGFVGRAHANKVLWHLLSGPALDGQHKDLNNLVTNMIYKARRDFDRPPREHRDLSWWSWSCYQYLYNRDKPWGPDQVPDRYWVLSMGPGGRPLPPPRCWGPHQ